MAQLLGLTDVNRIFLNLFFERFRDPQGRWAPKFHFEVPQERRESVLDFANEHYGQEFVAEKFCFVDMSALAQVPYLVTHLIRQERRPDFTLKTIWKEMSFHPDRRVFQRLFAGDTEGIYMLEGIKPGLLQRLSPISIEGLTDFLTLSVLTIDHPELVEAYVRRDPARDFPGKIIRDISLTHSATSGLILYDEQIMLLFCLLYSKWVADGFDLVKAVRKNQPDKVAEYRKRFLGQASRRCRLSREEILRWFARVAEAAAYVTCKATKAAEAMTIYQAGYLKCHYPDLFQQVLQEVREPEVR